MNCCHVKGLENHFDKKFAIKKLKRYQKKGADSITQKILKGIKERDMQGACLIDIGGGVGEVQFELLRMGVEKTISVEASSAFIEVAKTEARRLNLDHKMTYTHGDFVDLESGIKIQRVVSLVKVICCYQDWKKLIETSLSKSNKYFILVYPHDNRFAKFITFLENLGLSIFQPAFRVYIHSAKNINDLIADKGFKKIYFDKTFVWRIEIFEKIPDAA